MRFLVLAVGALLLVGCAQVVSVWAKPGATEEEERAIGKKCEYEAEAASQEGLTTEYARQERVRKLRDMCFEANGMVLVSRKVVPMK